MNTLVRITSKKEIARIHNVDRALWSWVTDATPWQATLSEDDYPERLIHIQHEDVFNLVRRDALEVVGVLSKP